MLAKRNPLNLPAIGLALFTLTLRAQTGTYAGSAEYQGMLQELHAPSPSPISLPSMRVTPRAGEALDAFHAVASPLGPRALGPQMPRVLAGKPLVGRGHVDAPRARELTMGFASAESGAYVLDGDIVHASDVRVRVGPVVRLAR